MNIVEELKRRDAEAMLRRKLEQVGWDIIRENAIAAMERWLKEKELEGVGYECHGSKDSYYFTLFPIGYQSSGNTPCKLEYNVKCDDVFPLHSYDFLVRGLTDPDNWYPIEEAK